MYTIGSGFSRIWKPTSDFRSRFAGKSVSGNGIVFPKSLIAGSFTSAMPPPLILLLKIPYPKLHIGSKNQIGITWDFEGTNNPEENPLKWVSSGREGGGGGGGDCLKTKSKPSKNRLIKAKEKHKGCEFRIFQWSALFVPNIIACYKCRELIFLKIKVLILRDFLLYENRSYLLFI